jgi:hypothetical protein
VLVIGAAMAVAAVFGPLWAVRVGVGLAVVAGVVACLYAWSEATAERRAGTAAVLAATREHGRALTAERTHNAEVVDVLTGRVETVRAELAERRVEITGLRTRVATLSGTVSTLRGDTAALRIELGRRDATIDVLRDTVAAREAELRVLTDDDGDDAEVHAWPRHLRTDPHAAAAPTDHPTGELPAVVDLHVLDTEVPSGIANYEPTYGRTADGQA